MEKIAYVRPGAIGDVVMILNFAQLLNRKCNPTIFCNDSIYAILANIVSKNKICNFRPYSEYNESEYNRTINLIGYPIHEGYPFEKMKSHLLEYFSYEMEVDFSFDSFVLDLPQFPKKIKNRNSPYYITFHNKTAWSTYKEWWGWQELINIIKTKKPNIEIYQIGGLEDPKMENIDDSFCGDSFEDNVAAQAWSRLHIGLDSVFNHTTNINWRTKGKIKSIILFGSTQKEASGYPHNENISLGLHCQPCFKENPAFSRNSLGLCENPPNQTYEKPQHACMKGITPEMVFEKMKL